MHPSRVILLAREMGKGFHTAPGSPQDGEEGRRRSLGRRRRRRGQSPPVSPSSSSQARNYENQAPGVPPYDARPEEHTRGIDQQSCHFQQFSKKEIGTTRLVNKFGQSESLTLIFDIIFNFNFTNLTSMNHNPEQQSLSISQKQRQDHQNRKILEQDIGTSKMADQICQGQASALSILKFNHINYFNFFNFCNQTFDNTATETHEDETTIRFASPEAGPFEEEIRIQCCQMWFVCPGAGPADLESGVPENVVIQKNPSSLRSLDCNLPLICPSPIPIIGRTASLQSTKLLNNWPCTPDTVSTNFHKAHKPEVCADFVNGQNMFNKLCYPGRADKTERLNRKEVFKLSPVKPLYFVCLSSLAFFQPGIVNRYLACHHTVHNPWLTDTTCRVSAARPGLCLQECRLRYSLPALGFVNIASDGGSGFGSQRVHNQRGNLLLSTGNWEVTVRPPVPWAGVVGVDPTWHPPGLWSSLRPYIAADNEFLVGLRTCKSANQELIGSKAKYVESCCRIEEEQGRTTATKNINKYTYPQHMHRKKARGKWLSTSVTAEVEESYKDSNTAAPHPPTSHLCATLTPVKPVHFGQPVNKYMHNCIYLFAGGQGQVIIWFKSAALLQPGLEARGDEARGDTGRGDTRPSGHLHEVVGGVRMIIEEFRDGGDGTEQIDGTEQFRSGQAEYVPISSLFVIKSHFNNFPFFHSYDRQVKIQILQTRILCHDNFEFNQRVIMHRLFICHFEQHTFPMHNYSFTIHCQNQGMKSRGTMQSNFSNTPDCKNYSPGLHIAGGCCIKQTLRMQGIGHQPGPRWEADDGSGYLLIESTNITALRSCAGKLAERKAHIKLVQEHSIPVHGIAAWIKSFAAAECQFDGGPLDPELNNTGGVGILTAPPYTTVQYQPVGQHYSQAYAMGRLAAHWCEVGTRTILIWNLYGWTGGATCEEAAQRSDDLFQIIKEETAQHEDVLSVIAADVNATDTDLPTLLNLTQTDQ